MWRASDAAQVALSQLAQAVELRFGGTEKDSWGQLRNGYVGVAPNDEDHIVYVVVDLPSVERTAVEKDLQAAAGDAITVRASQSCHSATSLAAVADQLSTGALVALTNSVYVSDLDPNTSTFRVGAYPKTKTAVSAFTAAVDSSLVKVTELSQPPTRDSGGRGTDAQPHWGGARITNQRTGGGCTSGFAIDTATAGKAFVSAGHCGLVGDAFESGSHAWGSVTRRGNFPERDMLIINASNQNYDDDIYLNPIWSVSNPIDVGGTRVVTQGNHVCVSGATTLAVCDLEVAGVNAQFCDTSTSCTSNLVRYDVSEAACNNGDSGAPLFSRWGSPEYARIVGMHLAEGSDSPVAGTPDGCMAHKFGTIEDTFNVTVATNPG